MTSVLHSRCATTSCNCTLRTEPARTARWPSGTAPVFALRLQAHRSLLRGAVWVLPPTSFFATRSSSSVRKVPGWEKFRVCSTVQDTCELARHAFLDCAHSPSFAEPHPYIVDNHFRGTQTRALPEKSTHISAQMAHLHMHNWTNKHIFLLLSQTTRIQGTTSQILFCPTNRRFCLFPVSLSTV